MPVDALSVIVRALSFVALLQAVGVAIFDALFRGQLTESRATIRRFGQVSALLGCLLVAVHQLLGGARMTGELTGIVDGAMQWFALSNHAGRANVLRMLGLLLTAFALRRNCEAKHWGLMGAVIVVLSFAMTGHTAVHPLRWLMAPLLVFHLSVVAFWFGSVAALYMLSVRETARTVSQVVTRFSEIATWLVPGIAVAGVWMATELLPNLQALLTPYGLLLLAKVAGFVLLMGLAALNKWRFGPALVTGEAQAARIFRRTLLIEYVLICAVLAATATMTGLFSPEP